MREIPWRVSHASRKRNAVTHNRATLTAQLLAPRALFISPNESNRPLPPLFLRRSAEDLARAHANEERERVRARSTKSPSIVNRASLYRTFGERLLFLCKASALVPFLNFINYLMRSCVCIGVIVREKERRKDRNLTGIWVFFDPFERVCVHAQIFRL